MNIKEFKAGYRRKGNNYNYFLPEKINHEFIWSDSTILPIPLISPPDSEGIRHAIPMDVASLIRIMSPPL